MLMDSIDVVKKGGHTQNNFDDIISEFVGVPIVFISPAKKFHYANNRKSRLSKCFQKRQFNDIRFFFSNEKTISSNFRPIIPIFFKDDIEAAIKTARG